MYRHGNDLTFFCHDVMRTIDPVKYKTSFFEQFHQFFTFHEICYIIYDVPSTHFFNFHLTKTNDSGIMRFYEIL